MGPVHTGRYIVKPSMSPARPNEPPPSALPVAPVVGFAPPSAASTSAAEAGDPLLARDPPPPPPPDPTGAAQPMMMEMPLEEEPAPRGRRARLRAWWRRNKHGTVATVIVVGASIFFVGKCGVVVID